MNRIFILAEKLSGVAIGTPLVRVTMATEGAHPGLRPFAPRSVHWTLRRLQRFGRSPLAPVDAAGGETPHMIQAQT
jgi:hypothetical protein